MRDKGVELLEAALVEDLLETLARRVLALGVLLGDALLATTEVRLLALVGQIEELAFDTHETSDPNGRRADNWYAQFVPARPAVRRAETTRGPEVPLPLTR